MPKQNRIARVFSRSNLAAVALIVAMGGAAPAFAQEHRESGELEAFQQRIHEMLEAAEEAHKKGEHARGRELEVGAQQLKERLHKAIEERHRAEDRRHEAEEREHAREERAHDRNEREHAREERDRDRNEREHAREGEHIEGGDRDAHEGDRAGPEEILGALKQGIWALKQLGREEEAHHLANLAEGYIKELRQRNEREGQRAREGDRRRETDREGANRERQVAERQLKILRYAVEGLVEAGRHDAAELVERWEHVAKLNLEGRRDRESNQIRERSPSRETLVKMLRIAAEELADQGRGERAGAVAELARTMHRPRQTDRAPQRERETDRRQDSYGARESDRAREGDRAKETDRRKIDRGPESDRRRVAEREGAEKRVRIVKRQIEIMELALPALREAERKDLAEQIVMAIRVREINLERRDGKEADAIREKAPSLGNTIEILNFAAALWGERFENKEKAGLLRELAQSMQPKREQRRERESDRETDRQKKESDRRERDDK